MPLDIFCALYSTLILCPIYWEFLVETGPEGVLTPRTARHDLWIVTYPAQIKYE